MKKVQFVANMSDIQLEVELDKYNGVKKILGVIAYGDIDDFDILPTKFKEEKNDKCRNKISNLQISRTRKPLPLGLG